MSIEAGLADAVEIAKAAIAATDRDSTIKAIREALKRRTGRTWSVRGGRGTAWGWIKISAPPARLVCGYNNGCDPVGCSHSRYYMSADDQAMLALALGKERMHFQGESIPASSDYRREYIDRAEGRKPHVYGEQYWD